MGRVFNDYGVFHFVSRSFTTPHPAASTQSCTAQDGAEVSVDELMKSISTVVIDEDESDSFTVRLDAKGFHPSSVAVRKVHDARCGIALSVITLLFMMARPK